MKLKLSAERDINMVLFNGRRQSGNILFKDLFHKIDHKIGYGYSEYMQVRKVGALDWKLLVYKCDEPTKVLNELRMFLIQSDPRIKLELHIVTDIERERLADRKPYLFVNDYDEP